MDVEQVPIMEFTLTNVIKNVSQMKPNVPNFTERVHQCNVPWSFSYGQTATHLSLFVRCEKPRAEVHWSLTARVHLSLNSSNGKCWIKAFIASFNNIIIIPSWGFREFITMEDLRQKLLINDELVVEAKIQILEMTGIGLPPSVKSFDDDEAKAMADVALLVGDRRFYVSKFTLANQSTYFKSLFFGNFKESNKSEVILKGINSDAFQLYLEVLHVEPALTDSCVEDVLQLSQMYDSKNVTRLCEDFFLLKSNLSTKRKLQLGCQYYLKELKKNCLESIKTAANVRACLGCGGIANGVKDAEVLNSLAEKLLSFLIVN